MSILKTFYVQMQPNTNNIGIGISSFEANYISISVKSLIGAPLMVTIKTVFQYNIVKPYSTILLYIEGLGKIITLNLTSQHLGRIG